MPLYHLNKTLDKSYPHLTYSLFIFHDVSTGMTCFASMVHASGMIRKSNFDMSLGIKGLGLYKVSLHIPFIGFILIIFLISKYCNLFSIGT